MNECRCSTCQAYTPDVGSDFVDTEFAVPGTWGTSVSGVTWSMGDTFVNRVTTDDIQRLLIMVKPSVEALTAALEAAEARGGTSGPVDLNTMDALLAFFEYLDEIA